MRLALFSAFILIHPQARQCDICHTEEAGNRLLSWQ